MLKFSYKLFTRYQSSYHQSIYLKNTDLIKNNIFPSSKCPNIKIVIIRNSFHCQDQIKIKSYLFMYSEKKDLKQVQSNFCFLAA